MELKSMLQPFMDLGMKVGDDHTRCPAHGGSDSVSCKVNKYTGHVVWKCHSCDAGGTIIDAYMAANEISAADAFRRLTEQYGGDTPRSDRLEYFKNIEQQKVKIMPTSIDIPFDSGKSFLYVDSNKNRKRIFARDAKIWKAMCLAGGDIMAAATLRWEINGEKVIRQAHFGQGKWTAKGFPHIPRPLYKEHELSTADRVIFVEGEKCMDALQDAVGDEYVVTTLVGGSKQIHKANIDALRGKEELIILPDFDRPGLSMAKWLQKEVGGRVIVLGDETKERGYDVADWLEEGGSVTDIFEMNEVNFGEPEVRDIDWAKSAASGVTTSDMYGFFQQLFEIGPNPVELDEILNILKETTGINKNSIKALWKQVLKEMSEDVPNMVADEMIQEVYGGHIISTGSQFWVYSGKCWQQVTDDVIKKNLLETAKDCVPSGTDLESTMRKAFQLTKAKCAKNGDWLGLAAAPRPIINVDNGELHIRSDGSWELLDHNPDNRMTYVLPVSYDPDAECPEYDRAIRQVMCHDDELLRHFEEVAGYLIQPRRYEKNYFMFYGQRGNNGKSKVKDLICQLIGNTNVLSVKLDKFGGGNHDNASLVGKMLLVDDDMKKGIKLDDGLLKTISELKLLTANPKGKATYQFMSYAAVLMCTNHWPMTTDLTKAMISRANIIPFNAYFDEHADTTDKELFTRIAENELSGVLNRFLEGFRRMKRRGRWLYPEACNETKKDWLLHTNNLFQFVDIYMEDDDDSYIDSPSLRDVYLQWCAMEGINRPVQNRRLRGYLEEMGFEIDTTERGVWCVQGQRLKQLPQLD